jgi:hypothetical protein
MTPISSTPVSSVRRPHRAPAVAMVCLLLAGGVRASTVTTGQIAQDQEQQSESREAAARARRIEGVWDVTVTLRDCQTGNPLPPPLSPIHARNMFIRGGTLTELNARGNPTVRNPSFGTWHIDDDGTYAAVFRYSRFNPDGTFSQTVKVTRQIRLSRDADAFAANAFVEVVDVNDMLVQTGCATEAATRLR